MIPSPPRAGGQLAPRVPRRSSAAAARTAARRPGAAAERPKASKEDPLAAALAPHKAKRRASLRGGP